MKIIRKKGKDLAELNVLIYAKDQVKLWEYREICYRIKERLLCEMHITLTNKIETVWSMITLLSGEIDIVLSDITFDKGLVKELDLKLRSYGSEEYHIIMKKQNGYIDIRRINKNMTCIEHWENKRDELEDKVFCLISKMQRTH